MPGPNGQKCKNCYFYNVVDYRFYCVVNPPAFHEPFPRIDDDNWCGHFQNRAELRSKIAEQKKLAKPLERRSSRRRAVGSEDC